MENNEDLRTKSQDTKENKTDPNTNLLKKSDKNTLKKIENLIFNFLASISYFSIVFAIFSFAFGFLMAYDYLSILIIAFVWIQVSQKKLNWVFKFNEKILEQIKTIIPTSEPIITIIVFFIIILPLISLILKLIYLFIKMVFSFIH